VPTPDDADTSAPGQPFAPPGPILRAFAGAWHVPAGFAFLIRHPSLWPMSVLPALLTVALIVVGAVAGAFAIRPAEAALIPARGHAPTWLVMLMTLGLWASTVAAGMLMGLAVALLLAAPVLERLSRRVEAHLRGVAPEEDRGLRWELAASFRTSAYFLVRAPGVLALGLIPLLGPVLALAWGAHSLAFQQTEATLARHGLDFAARRAWHRRWRIESLGFGIAGLVILLIPLANVLLLPALSVGGTRLALELTDDVGAPGPA
jgi:uncharacterized protein involved in cysteine biosynthesis